MPSVFFCSNRKREFCVSALASVTTTAAEWDDNRNLKLDWNRVLGDKRSVSGSFGAADTADGTKLSTDFKMQPMPELKLGAGLNHTLLDGGGTATGGSLSADWRSKGLGASLAAALEGTGLKTLLVEEDRRPVSRR